ncbi:hypothetical protein H8959_002589 [Pygathrix nigripes]
MWRICGDNPGHCREAGLIPLIRALELTEGWTLGNMVEKWVLREPDLAPEQEGRVPPPPLASSTRRHPWSSLLSGGMEVPGDPRGRNFGCAPVGSGPPVAGIAWEDSLGPETACSERHPGDAGDAVCLRHIPLPNGSTLPQSLRFFSVITDTCRHRLSSGIT